LDESGTTIYGKRTQYQLEFGFTPWGDVDGLNAFLARYIVVETEEGLVWPQSCFGVLVDDLEGEF
jgi:hypothetical protein